MKLYENGCVGCPSWMGCLGNACPYKYYYNRCDNCNNDNIGDDIIYNVNGEELCIDCLLEKYEIELTDDDLYIIDEIECNLEELLDYLCATEVEIEH